ncbi:hypothetical protein DFH28DRAFT_1121512 [Melampsora americana]|nr:hypothetical protein DFH28DRAFT_1121512 [Melampsora americana]
MTLPDTRGHCPPCRSSGATKKFRGRFPQFCSPTEEVCFLHTPAQTPGIERGQCQRASPPSSSPTDRDPHCFGLHPITSIHSHNHTVINRLPDYQPQSNHSSRKSSVINQ